MTERKIEKEAHGFSLYMNISTDTYSLVDLVNNNKKKRGAKSMSTTLCQENLQKLLNIGSLREVNTVKLDSGYFFFLPQNLIFREIKRTQQLNMKHLSTNIVYKRYIEKKRQNSSLTNNRRGYYLLQGRICKKKSLIQTDLVTVYLQYSFHTFKI